jgi:hypothetical protein
MTPEFILPYVTEKSHAGGGDTPTEGITKIIQKFASITTNVDERRKATGWIQDQMETIQECSEGSGQKPIIAVQRSDSDTQETRVCLGFDAGAQSKITEDLSQEYEDLIRNLGTSGIGSDPNEVTFDPNSGEDGTNVGTFQSRVETLRQAPTTPPLMDSGHSRRPNQTGNTTTNDSNTQRDLECSMPEWNLAELSRKNEEFINSVHFSPPKKTPLLGHKLELPST